MYRTDGARKSIQKDATERDVWYEPNCETMKLNGWVERVTINHFQSYSFRKALADESENREKKQIEKWSVHKIPVSPYFLTCPTLSQCQPTCKQFHFWSTEIIRKWWPWPFFQYKFFFQIWFLTHFLIKISHLPSKVMLRAVTFQFSQVQNHHHFFFFSILWYFCFLTDTCALIFFRGKTVDSRLG